MGLLFWVSAGVLAVNLAAALELAWGRLRTRDLSDVEPLPDGQLPMVSVVVPARDEERHIESALNSLLGQDYPRFEVLAVDDRSGDATPRILDRVAARHEKLRRLRIEQLPEGWLGKTHALHFGAERARGELLLFTDADVHFEPDALRLAVSHLQREGIGHVAVGPDVRPKGVLLTALMMAFALSFTLFQKPWRARDPDSRHFVGIGAFNLFRRAAYRRSGGMARISLRVDDDVMLGKILKASGSRQECLAGHGLVWLEWYSSVAEMVRGLGKNAFAALDYSLPRAVGGFLFVLLFHLGPVAALAFTGGPTLWCNLGSVALMLGAFAALARFLERPMAYALAYPAAFALLAFTLARSTALTLWRGGIEWRGTRYPLRRLKSGPGT